MFEAYTYDAILATMLSSISDEYDKREGSIIWDALSPVALEISNMYRAFDDMLQETFGDTASREYLVRLGAERGLEPYPASKAVVKGVFAPSTVEVPIGNRLNCPNATYVVVEKIADGEYKLECETPGTIGNGYLGTLIPIEYVEGLETAELTQILIYGEDDESTEAFRTRYLNSFDERAFSGNRQDYLEKCLAIPGVGSLKIEPVWNGAGSVRLTVLNSEYGKATDELIALVQHAFDPNGDGKGDGLAPIGHVVTVRTVDETTINVTMNVTFDIGYSWATHQSLIENAINDYLSNLKISWASEDYLIVRISQIEARVLSIDGIVDVDTTTINGASSNLILDAFAIPVLGGVGE